MKTSTRQHINTNNDFEEVGILTISTKFFKEPKNIVKCNLLKNYNDMKLRTATLNFTERRLKIIKITKVLRIITILFPFLLLFLIPLDYSVNFKWVFDGIALIGCVILLFWLFFSIILHYYPISYSIDGSIKFNLNDKSISISNSMKETNYYPINKIEIVYSTRIRYKMNILISDYTVHNKFINLLIYLKNGSFLEFYIEKNNPNLLFFLSSLIDKGVKVKKTERFSLI